MRIRLLALGLALILALTACGGDDDGGDTTSAPIGADDTVAAEDTATPAGDVASQTVDACALVSEATVASIAEGASPTATEGSFGDDYGAASGCRWDDGDFLFPVEVSVTAGADAYTVTREFVTELGGIETPEVSGVGDEAFTYDEGSGVIEVITRQGDMVVSVRVRSTDPSAAIGIANEALSNL